MSAELTLERITKHYGATTAVDDITLRIEPGELFVLVGPSGAGKSTVLKIVAGLIAPDAGSVVLGGRDLTTVPLNLRGIGVVFQDYALFPRMTARQNVGFPLAARAVDGFAGWLRFVTGRGETAEVRRKVDSMLETVQLSEHSEKLPRQLSGGQQQRVALARALVFDPELLCFDEPLGALDRSLKLMLQSEIQRVQRRFGKTTLYVTHDQSEAMMMADRIAVMNDGRIVQTGRPAEVYDAPADAFVAGFLGECNRFEVRAVVAAAGAYRVTTAGGSILFTRTEPRPGHHTLGVRPERIRLARPEEPETLEGRLTAMMCLGSQWRWTVAVNDREEIAVLIPAGVAPPRTIGETVRLVVDMGAIMVLS